MKEIDMLAMARTNGFRLGNAQDRQGGTGCTVLVFPDSAPCAVDVRGGGPASRESELLSPMAAASGTPPNLFAEIRGDAFAPRNPQALKIDFVRRPPYFTVSPTHKAKTWLLDPRAPRVEPPAAVKMLREEGL